MKIRSGFISNSSSSSFIVGFSKMPASPEKLEIMMFGESREVQPYDSIPATSTIEIAKRVFADINRSTTRKYANKRQLIKALVEEHGYFPGCPCYWTWDERKSRKIEKAYREKTGKDIWDETADPKVRKYWKKVLNAERKQEKKEIMIASKAFVEGFWPRVKGCKVFDLSYADENGEENLEHGNIFRNLAHIQISHY